ncbi:Pyridoxal phosphate-dependent transferase major region subdomain 2 [Penicillium brevicompactum]|uniref:Pyridoxal phosphate-dependent transferase major region subdomain 2 n=1 Tax=Penicillium brevicompactum TaxID=5074 RepID=UPI002541D1DF|nr:Pyridoxal phosphate-dependent transferase major region subdomain 2 [Penicillium brevicompactum]KAJ5333007.1 Pyridoxal phosphate-dependent transferase major region subdomain 2 [Penicillium brevicompactum]
MIDSFHRIKDVQELNERILQRLSLDGVDGISCLAFPSLPGASRCARAIQEAGGTENTVIPVQFSRPDSLPGENSWLDIHAIIFPSEYFSAAFLCWIHTGDGISPRHAAFCLTGLDYLQSISINPAFCTASPKTLTVKGEHVPSLHTSGVVERDCIKEEIATLVQSEDLEQVPPSPSDVFLYPGGMAAVNAVARVVGDLEINTGVFAFGWLYTETMKVLEHRWPDITTYKRSGDNELDQLEASLRAGTEINALWVDVPSNPLLVTPDMPRIRRLANEYHFLVLIDGTVGTFVNVDLLPYGDVLMSSLTKIYSGYANVLAGSAVVNPQSSHYESLHRQLTTSYENTLFPGDLAKLIPRVKATNKNAEIVAAKLAAHPAIERVNFPTMTARKNYESIRRPGGGYSNLMSIIFRENETALRFYDRVGIFKGASFGTVFTLSTPFAQLATDENRRLYAEAGIPSHIVRMSIGAEDVDTILDTLLKALATAILRD